MEQLLNEIRVQHVEPSVNSLISGLTEDAPNAPYAMRFNQNEDYFIELDAPLLVPRLPIHHDFRQTVPPAAYLQSLREIMKQLLAKLPGCFAGLTYFFDPGEILKPCFFHLYRAGDEIYLYLMRIDLLPKPFESETIEAGTNDVTPAYATRRLYVESELVPLESVAWDGPRPTAFRIRQIISQTWIGETGKGYLVRGIWMDTDLSKFFTKLFVPEGKRFYPFYPLFCKYKTVCCMSPVLSSGGRRSMIPVLHRALGFLVPEMAAIQDLLRNQDFAESIPEFKVMRTLVPEDWKRHLSRFSVESYLNHREQKEYGLDYAGDED